MDKQYVTIEEVSRIELLNLMNEAFEDYVFNFHWNLESLERDLIENSISAKDSAILRINGSNVGFFLVGLRGNICRIGLMGMIKKFRGSGYGLEMLDKIVEGCKWKNVNKIILEVPEMDYNSRKFYERYGFRVKRDLVSFYKSLSVDEDINISLEPLPFKDLQDIAIEVSGKYQRKYNWYNDPKALSHLKFYNFSGILKDDKLLGYCIWSYKDEYVYVMDFGPTAEPNFQDMVKYLECSFNGTYEKLLIPWVPEDDILFSILSTSGYNKLATQKEMELRLTH